MADPDTPGLIASFLGAVGLSGWGGRQLWNLSKTSSGHAARLEASEETLARHDETIEELKTARTETAVVLDTMAGNMEEVKGGIKKLVDHITGTNLG